LEATRYITPPPRVSSAEWLQSHVVMPAGTETSGQPFSLAAFPHVDGVLAAFDDPSVRIIVLQWGTRLGKTTSGLSLLAETAAVNPRNMMIAGPTKDAIGRVVDSRLYPLFGATEGVKNQLLPEHRRNKFHVKMNACQIFVAWSGSDSSLADVGARVGDGIEIDKWTTNSSDEADPLALFLNRFKGFTDHKVILESTPTIKGKSRVEHWMGRSNRHKRYVPCPHCGEFQVLRKGDADTPGGFRWDRDESGQSDPDISYRTAWYECEKCLGRIENYHRVPMLRKGVWCPDGCTVNNFGEIVGTATRAGSDVVGFGPLPSWYALTETWGSFARAFIRAKRRPGDLQDVVNSYMAETWEIVRTKTTPERIAERIQGATARGVVPVGGRFLTVTVDRQQADGGFCPWVVLAHGADDRVWEIEHGIAESLVEVWEKVIRRQYKHADGGLNMTPTINAIDSGWATKQTYDFCNAHTGVLACKGSSGDLGNLPYRLSVLDDKSRTESDGQSLLMVNTDFWETALQTMLDERLANEPGSLTLAVGSGNDTEFMAQLCNAVLADKVDSRGNPRLLWVKKEESQPNDWRDAVKYGICLGRLWIESNGLPSRGELPSNPVSNQPSSQGFVRQTSSSWIRR
jgi:phage terminase large subunit GpA-like protein